MRGFVVHQNDPTDCWRLVEDTPINHRIGHGWIVKDAKGVLYELPRSVYKLKPKQNQIITSDFSIVITSSFQVSGLAYNGKRCAELPLGTYWEWADQNPATLLIRSNE